MASGGFFRGTSVAQDSRYFNQNKKLLAKMTFPPCFSERVDLTKVKLEVIHQWVTQRITQLLGFEDDIVASLVINLLEPKVDERLDPRELQVAITGFLEKDAAVFTKELWELLLSAQTNVTGIPTQLLEQKKRELEQVATDKDALRRVLERKRLEAAGSTGPIAVAQQLPVRTQEPRRLAASSVRRNSDRRGRDRSRSPPQHRRSPPQHRRSPSPRRRRDRSASRSPLRRHRRYRHRSPSPSPPRKRHERRRYRSRSPRASRSQSPSEPRRRRHRSPSPSPSRKRQQRRSSSRSASSEPRGRRR